MAWIRTVPETEAKGKLAEVYRRVKERAGKAPKPASGIAGAQLRPLLPVDGFTDGDFETGTHSHRYGRVEDKRVPLLNGVARERPPVGGR
jgi:hypothetical protein